MCCYLYMYVLSLLFVCSFVLSRLETCIQNKWRTCYAIVSNPVTVQTDFLQYY